MNSNCWRYYPNHGESTLHTPCQLTTSAVDHPVNLYLPCDACASQMDAMLSQMCCPQWNTLQLLVKLRVTTSASSVACAELCRIPRAAHPTTFLIWQHIDAPSHLPLQVQILTSSFGQSIPQYAFEHASINSPSNDLQIGM